MNYKNEDMDGVVCPNDSRFRDDIRFYEQGKIEQAEAEKIIIEEK